MAPDYTDDLRLAHVLADDADSTATARFKALDLHVMTKPDLTPVTDADQSVEEGIRRVNLELPSLCSGDCPGTAT